MHTIRCFGFDMDVPTVVLPKSTGSRLVASGVDVDARIAVPRSMGLVVSSPSALSIVGRDAAGNEVSGVSLPGGLWLVIWPEDVSTVIGTCTDTWRRWLLDVSTLRKNP